MKRIIKVQSVYKPRIRHFNLRYHHFEQEVTYGSYVGQLQ